MKLNVSKREAQKKSQAKQLRRKGQIPAVIYSKGEEGEAISLALCEFETALRNIPKGRLATTIFTLEGEGGKRRAIVKDIQYHVTTYAIVHLDFEELHDDVTLSVNVPIECTGIADCQGIKLGGVLRQVLRSVRVKCLPKDMPEAFELDVRAMKMSDAKRLSDISFPAGVKPVVDLNEVALAIVKR